MEVEANSLQLKFLAAALLADPAMSAVAKDIEEFELAIIQPAFDPPVTKATITRAEAEVFLRTIKLAHSASKAPAAEVRIGKWCKWCRAKAVCPAQRQMFADLIDIKIHPDWSPQELGDILIKAKQVEKLIETVQERVKHELANGRTVPGWRLKAGSTRMAWAQSVKAIQPITPAAAKKALKLNELPDDLVVKSTSAPSLARDTDAADAVLPVAAFAKAAALLKGNR